MATLEAKLPSPSVSPAHSRLRFLYDCMGSLNMSTNPPTMFVIDLIGETARLCQQK